MPIFKEYHAPKFLGAVFFLILLGACYFAYKWNQGEMALRAQETQVIRECEDKHKDDIVNAQVSFQGVTVDRIGTSQIEVRGKMYYTGADGQSASRDFSCETEAPAAPLAP